MKPSDSDSPENQQLDAESLQLVPDLPVDEDGPVFAEPWQAQAFAMAVSLSNQGFFSWQQWADALAAELQCSADKGEPDDGSHYYHHWVAALEKLVTQENLVLQTTLDAKKESWADAYRHTPHGQPVTLDAEG